MNTSRMKLCAAWMRRHAAESSAHAVAVILPIPATCLAIAVAVCGCIRTPELLALSSMDQGIIFKAFQGVRVVDRPINNSDPLKLGLKSHRLSAMMPIAWKIGLGCMRLSTAADRNEERAISVIHAALDAGATLLDTSDAYCLDDTETGHNERLIAQALASWAGDRSRVVVATKGGLRRPSGKWVNDAKAKSLRAACDASRRALGVDVIDLYQLHAVDPKTPLETSVRALATLKDDGWIRQIGLCNVTVTQISVKHAL